MLPQLCKYKFVFDFLQKRKIYSFYSGVRDNANGECYELKDVKLKSSKTHRIHVVNYIPPFLQPQIEASQKGKFNLITMKYYHGFMADLSNCHTLDNYLKNKMSSKSRTKMRSYVKKLETCYTIEYKLYFGEIPKRIYDELFQKFRTLIEQRFSQRGDTHELLNDWDSIQKDSYRMILEKEASLFVIYNGKEPIDICLNYHVGNIMHNGIRSYDIAYSKFRLGYIDIMKQLEWCFSNNIKIFDLSVGDMDYKRLWCNTVYDFEHHIIYPKNNVWLRLIAFGLSNFYRAKEFLKEKNLHLLYKRFKSFLKKEEKSKNRWTEPHFEVLSDFQFSMDQKKTLLNLEDEKNAFLKRQVNDFQYHHLEPSKEIRIYKIKNGQQIYLIEGKTKKRWLRLVG